MRAQQQGFALVAAIILVVILAALSAFVASMVGGQSANQQLERMTRVTDLAARAGLEWGAYQVMRSATAPPSLALPSCPNTIPGAPRTLPTLPGSLAVVTVTVTCTTPSPGSTYQITATAKSGGTPDQPDYVERQKTAIFVR